VTLVVAATGSDTIVILGARDIERTTDFVTAGDLRAESLNEQLDSLVIFDQQIDERVDRAIRAPAYDPTDINMELPAKSNRAGKLLGFNSVSGDPVVSDINLSQLEALQLAQATTNDALGLTFEPSGSGATTRIVQSKLRETVSIEDFGASPTATGAENTAAIQAALNAHKSVYVPQNTYEVDGTIVIGGSSDQLIIDGTLTRSGASTDPVIRINASNASVIGNGSGVISTPNASPNGIILFGPVDPSTQSHNNILWSRVQDLLIAGNLGATSKGIVFHTEEGFGGSQANYFNWVNNCQIRNVNEGIYLMRAANGHVIHGCQFYRIGENCIHLDGTQGTNFSVGDVVVSNITVHFSGSLQNIIKLQNANRNTFSNIGGEPGSGRVFNFDATSGANLITGYNQTPSSNIDNAGTNIKLFNGTVSTLNMAASATFTETFSAKPDGTNTAVEIDSNGLITGYLADRKRPIGSNDKSYATGVKFNTTINNASVSFTLSCDAQASIYRHGYLWLKCGGGDSAAASDSSAWFLLSARSNLTDAYPSINTTPKDSGGDTGSFTVSYSAGVLTIDADANDDSIVVEATLALPGINNVNIT
jgi:hypothetical protein